MAVRPFSVDPSATAAFERIKESIPKKMPRRGIRAVVIGGGTGAPMSIKTLLSLGIETSAVVAMADDGGSTGELREVANVTPPGDIRKCLTAFAKDSHAPFTQAFKYRFEFAKNHSLGNLLISALEDATGSFPEAIRVCEELLQAQGHVYPSTLAQVRLCAQTKQGHLVQGQARASHSDCALHKVWLESMWPIRAYEPALQAIKRADLLVLGPGSLFTSIIPNLMVPGLVQAIKESRAKTVFVCSLADMQGETRGMSALEHVQALLDHGMQGALDYVLVHTPVALKKDAPVPLSTLPPHLDLSAQDLPYNKRDFAEIRPVYIDYAQAQAIQALGPAVIARNLVDPKRPTWHDPQALREAFSGVMKLCHLRQK